MAIDDPLALVRNLALLCRDEGIRRARLGGVRVGNVDLGEVEVEMAAVRNPLVDSAPAKAPRPGPGGEPPPRPRADEWMDAIGSMSPVIRPRKGE